MCAGAARGTRPRAESETSRSPAAKLEEAVGLALAIDLSVVSSGIVPLGDIRPATYLGKGKVEEIAGLVKSHEAGIVVMDCPLSPVQQRNLEKAWGAKVRRPHRAHPGDFRPARAHARRRAAGRAGAPDLPEEPAGAVLDPSRTPARRLRLPGRAGREPARDRPPADRGADRAASRPNWKRSSARASSIAPAASACRIRSWRWSATPMPASRRCSTG